MTDYTDTQRKALTFFENALKRADKATEGLERASAENTEAQGELSWVAAHPALANIDLGAIAAEVRGQGGEGLASTPDAKVDEPPKAKRTRRTKAQIAADEAAAQAAQNAAADEARDAGPADAAEHAAPEQDDTFSDVPAEEAVSTFVAPSITAPVQTPPPATNPFGNQAAPAAGGFVNPFGG